MNRRITTASLEGPLRGGPPAAGSQFGPRARARAAASTISLIALLSCHKTSTFTLPDRPMKPSVAFIALYEGERPREVGPVVPYTRIYSGSYAIESGKTGLDARLFFVEEAELQKEASARCSDLTDALQKVACKDRVADCPRDPSSCLYAQIRGAGCGDRLTLSSAMKVTEFRTDKNADLRPAPEGSSSLGELELCGPSLANNCQILLPGFVVTENGRYRCTAPSRQRECTLEVDLSVCGLGRVTGEVGADGSFAPPVPIAGCESGPLMSGEAFGGSSSGFAITCDTRRFVASYMMQLIGETSCTRRGPTIFNNPLFDSGSPFGSDGFVRGVKFTHFPGAMPRLLFDGTGVDGCAERGCELRGSCTTCDLECNELILLPDCANANAWDPCTMVDSVFDCQKRCEEICAAPPLNCAAKLQGHTVTFAKAEEPERPLNTFSMNGSSTSQSITGAGSLALVPHGNTTFVAIASRNTISLLRPSGDDLEEPVPLTGSVGFDIAGIIRLSGGSGRLLIFGRSTGAGSTGVVAHAQVSDDVDPTLSYDPEIALTTPTADAVVELGNGLLLAASLDPPITDASANVAQLSAFPNDGTEASSIALDGAPTALGSMAGGFAIAGVRLASGETLLEVFAPSGADANKVASLMLPRGLVPKVMLADPERCENASEPCLTYVGFELEGANRDNGRAVVGIVEHERGNPAGAHLVPSFVQTASPELSLLEIDTERDVLYVVAAAANRITPIQLAR